MGYCMARRAYAEIDELIAGDRALYRVRSFVHAS